MLIGLYIHYRTRSIILIVNCVGPKSPFLLNFLKAKPYPRGGQIDTAALNSKAFDVLSLLGGYSPQEAQDILSCVSGALEINSILVGDPAFEFQRLG